MHGTENEWRIARPVFAGGSLIAAGAAADALRKLPIGAEGVVWRAKPTMEVEIYTAGTEPQDAAGQWPNSERLRFVLEGREELPNGELRVRFKPLRMAP